MHIIELYRISINKNEQYTEYIVVSRSISR